MSTDGSFHSKLLNTGFHELYSQNSVRMSRSENQTSEPSGTLLGTVGGGSPYLDSWCLTYRVFDLGLHLILDNRQFIALSKHLSCISTTFSWISLHFREYQLENRGTDTKIDRSQSLLGVRSWERYQNDRKKEYFQFVWVVFTFKNILGFVFSQNWPNSVEKHTFIWDSSIVNLVVSTSPNTSSRIWYIKNRDMGFTYSSG